jgi:tetratricopeptide (TPR) repeat protein
VSEVQLDTLEAKGLIRLATYRPELEYLFRHALVQDAAYGSLLKQERRDLHRRVGEALETLYPDRRGELASVLAMHFEQAGETQRAIEYLIQAGTFGLERNALSESFDAFDRAKRLLATLPPSDDLARKRKAVEIEVGRVRAGWSARSMDEVDAELQEIEPLVAEVDDPRLEVPIRLIMALGLLFGGGDPDDPRAKAALQRIGELADRIGDPSLRALPLAFIGLTRVFGGPIREGVQALEEAVPLMQRDNQNIGAAFARGALAIGYAQLGEFAKAEAAAADAVELAKNGDVISQLDAAIAQSWVRASRGDLDGAAPLARSCIERSEESGATTCAMASSWILGDVLARQGQFEDARVALSRGDDIAGVADRRQWRPMIQAWLGAASAAIGGGPDTDWEGALENVRFTHNRVAEAGILWKRGEVRIRSGDVADGAADLRAAAAIMDEEGARPNLARVLAALGNALRAQGPGEEADVPLRRALTLFEELGLDREAGEVRLALAAPTIQLG